MEVATAKIGESCKIEKEIEFLNSSYNLCLKVKWDFFEGFFMGFFQGILWDFQGIFPRDFLMDFSFDLFFFRFLGQNMEFWHSVYHILTSF